MIRIKFPDKLGETIYSTAVIHSLKNKFPLENIIVSTKYPELLEGLPVDISECDNSDIDMSKNSYSLLNNSKPYKPFYVHSIKKVSEKIKKSLDIIPPKICLSEDELSFAKKKIKEFPKPAIWVQTETSSKNKNWPEEYWNELFGNLENDYSVIKLSNKYSLRQSLAITKVCEGGITLDSFLSHGSFGVGAKNVMLIIGSSRKEVVSYPEQEVLFASSNCKLQPCGFHEKSEQCIYDAPICMSSIKPEDVLSKVYKKIKR